MKTQDYNSFETAQQQVDRCADILGLGEDLRAILRVPMKELPLNLPVRMDSGATRVFPAFRVQYNNALGPTKGGIRFHPRETVDTVRALAAWMTWKCSLMNLPLGGAKGGVICNPREMSAGELERLSRAYIQGISPLIGPRRDVPAPDVYTDSRIMAWMMDEYCRLTGESRLGVITGKPLELGGSQGRHDATARGGMYVLREAAGSLGLKLKNARVAIQGFGNAGYHAAELVRDLYGCRVTAVGDSRGGVRDDRGLDLEKLIAHKKRCGSVAGYPGAEAISNEELLLLEVEVLMPAALENVINRQNAARVRAKIVAELANGAITPSADQILHQKGVYLLPDILCNSGGVTVSYFEMVQNFSLVSWDSETVFEQLEKKMSCAYREVADSSRRHRLNMREAAYVIAVERVVKAMRWRGWVS